MMQHMRHGPAMVLALLAWVALGTASATSAGQERTPGTWEGVSQVIAVGDLHGSYDKAVRLLQSADLLDADLQWVGGDRHLVAAGDILDRGTGGRKLMDLFRRLQPESEAAGGRVHILLGNHEVMNLMRDLRYVNPTAYQDFAGEEKPKDRKAAWRAFSKAGKETDTEDALKAKFETDYPPGYIGRQKSLNADGEYGSWLLSLPVIVKINGVVYLHGGLTMEVAALGVEEINRKVGEDLRRHLAARETLEDMGVIKPWMTFGDIRWIANDGLARLDSLSPEVQPVVQELHDTSYSKLLGGEGPLWYRGSSFEDERIEREMLERSLELLGARAMVVAHSPTTGKEITSRFHDQLFRVDHNISGSEALQALVVEGDNILVLDATTKEKIRAPQELPTGRIRSRPASEMSDSELEAFLSGAKVIDSRDLGRGTTRPRLLELELGGNHQRGIFKIVSDDDSASAEGVADRHEYEVAAYRLDRMIGLNMVPPAVLREIDGQQGSLQSWVEGAVDQEAAAAYQLQFFKSDKAVDQLVHGRVFDALIGNQTREPDDILTLLTGDRLFLIDHSKSFSTSPEIDWDPGERVPIDAPILTALQALDREALEREMADLLSESQIEALLERRDRILDRAVNTADESPPNETRVGSGTGGNG